MKHLSQRTSKVKLKIDHNRGKVFFRSVKVSVKDYRNMGIISKIIVIDLCDVIILTSDLSTLEFENLAFKNNVCCEYTLLVYIPAWLRSI